MPTPPAPEAILTSAQAATRLGCSIRTVHRRIAAGELPIVGKLPGPNGAYLLAEADVVAALTPAEQSA